ncbi:MAG: universal stress protein [Acetobacteraceae bacterium]|nr:universal stress protein [Acetobacteraceae bacterium]
MKILLPVDGSPLGAQALGAVEALCAREPGSSVEVLEVLDPLAAVGPLQFLLKESRAEHYVADQVAILEEHGILATSEVAFGAPARKIISRAVAGGFDCVCMASRGRSGLARAWSGSVTDEVIRDLHVPVMVVRPKPVNN